MSAPRPNPRPGPQPNPRPGPQPGPRPGPQPNPRPGPQPNPRLSITTHALEPGESLSPYHFDHGNESWALVIEGGPTLRDPDGEHVLDPGDVVCFIRGPAGAHQLTNAGAGHATVIVISTRIEPTVTVYPDDGTLLVTPPGRQFRERDAIAPAGHRPASI